MDQRSCVHWSNKGLALGCLSSLIWPLLDGFFSSIQLAFQLGLNLYFLESVPGSLNLLYFHITVAPFPCVMEDPCVKGLTPLS